ncbi:MAG: P-loop NTPase [Nitrospirae bacterium]|nr:P-loop NTPase [Nitrospirota bacterium]
MMNIVFWSYKGGSGRSICAANLAIRLSEKKNVGMLDFDFEAPGLHTIFGLPEEEVASRGFLADYFQKRSLTDIHSSVWNIGDLLKEKDGKDRSLFLLPNMDHPAALDEIDWTGNDIITFIQDLFNKVTTIYDLDYLIIDARSGFSAMSAIAIQFVGHVMLFFRPNIQHRSGIARALKIFKDQGVKINIIASQVPDSTAANDFLVESSTLFQQQLDYVLPFDNDFAVGEKLLLNNNECGAISDLFNKMAENIIGGIQIGE